MILNRKNTLLPVLILRESGRLKERGFLSLHPISLIHVFKKCQKIILHGSMLAYLLSTLVFPNLKPQKSEVKC